jgi:hypothetical protein
MDDGEVARNFVMSRLHLSRPASKIRPSRVAWYLTLNSKQHRLQRGNAVELRPNAAKAHKSSKALQERELITRIS